MVENSFCLKFTFILFLHPGSLTSSHNTRTCTHLHVRRSSLVIVSNRNPHAKISTLLHAHIHYSSTHTLSRQSVHRPNRTKVIFWVLLFHRGIQECPSPHIHHGNQKVPWNRKEIDLRIKKKKNNWKIILPYAVTLHDYDINMMELTAETAQRKRKNQLTGRPGLPGNPLSPLYPGSPFEVNQQNEGESENLLQLLSSFDLFKVILALKWIKKKNIENFKWYICTRIGWCVIAKCYSLVSI